MAEKSPASYLERLGDPTHTLYLVDISSFIFRAFYAIRPLHTRAKEPVNAVYGVATMMARLAEEGKPAYLAAIYDSKEPSFRKEIYPEYKANRSAPPEDLVPQFDRVEQLIQCMGIHSYRYPGVEADDLIGTLTRRWTALDPRNRVVVVTSDKDLMQLVNERVLVWDTMSQKIYGSDEVKEKFGVTPAQLRDYLALVGDSSDNIPGVTGIGPKGASDLLNKFGTLEGVLKAAADGEIPGKKADTLKEQAETARLSAELATVHEALTVEVNPEDFRYKFAVSDACVEFLRAMDFHTLVSRWAPNAGAAETDPKDSAGRPPVSGGGDSQAKRPDADASVSEEVQPSLLDAAGRAPSAGARVPAIEVRKLVASEDAFRTINTEKQLSEVLEQLEKRGEFGFDLETTSLNPRAAELVGVAICYDRAFGTYIPVGHRGSNIDQLPEKLVMEKLRPFLESEKCRKIGQNLKYDFSVLCSQGFDAKGVHADTMVAGYVVDAEGRHNLQTLARNYLDYEVKTYEEVCGKGKDQLCFDQVPIDQATRYSAEDAWVAVHLWDALERRLDQEGVMDVFRRIDLPLVQVLSRMERQGVCVDVDWLTQLSGEFKRDLKAIEERIYEISKPFSQTPLNLNSPKQLGAFLFEQLKLPPQGKTKTGYSTDAQVLDALAPLHEAPKLILEFREISKLMGTYVDPLPGLRDPRTGRIHATFNQTVAATGRLSSSDPNLQNIPIRTERGRKIRRAFIPSPGNVLISADYSQIELRLLAHMSRDPDLMGSFLKDEDVHRRTASEIFGVKTDAVDDRQRGIAKAINFGLMYGKTAFGLSQELKIGRKEAQDIINRYFERYSGVKRYLDGLIEEAKDTGFSKTLLGRKRNLPDISSRNPAVRNNAERMAMNAPIQGTAADLMKLAMIEIDKRLAEGGYESRLIIQVHDEVVLDCPRKEAKEIERLISEAMESALKLDVPLRVNSASGENWMDL